MDTLTLDLVTNTVLDRVSDSELDKEYRKRFFLSAGESSMVQKMLQSILICCLQKILPENTLASFI